MSRTQFNDSNSPEQNFKSVMATVDSASLREMNNAQKQALMRVLPTIPQDMLMDQTTDTQLKTILALYPQLAVFFMSMNDTQRQMRLAQQFNKDLNVMYPSYPEKLSEHASSAVRLAVAKNAFITKQYPKITQYLLNDDDTAVSAAARLALHAQNLSRSSPAVKHR